MMRSSNSKNQGKVEAVNSNSPLENGLSSKEEEEELDQNVRELAAKVVDDVVKKASEAAQRKTEDQSTPKKNKGCNIQRLPTIQIDTVPSPPPSPDELTPLDEANEIEEPVDESDIQLDLEQESDNAEDLKERVKSYVEGIISEAMVLAEKKIQFAGLPDDDEEEEEEQVCEPIQSTSVAVNEKATAEEEIDESEIRATAEKVVQEVIEKASETAAEKLENRVVLGLSFPGLPSIQIDKPVPSPPPSPEEEEASVLPPKKKWTFKVEESFDTDSEKNVQIKEKTLIKFDEAPEDVKEVATSFVKDIVGKAIAMAEEKSAPTVPFNFEDVDLMKTNGPWYIRAREALIRLLRTACFCTPRRTDS